MCGFYVKPQEVLQLHHPRGSLSLALQDQQLSLWPGIALWRPDALLYASLPSLPNLVHNAWYVVTISPIFPPKSTPAPPLSYTEPAIFSSIVSIYIWNIIFVWVCVCKSVCAWCVCVSMWWSQATFWELVLFLPNRTQSYWWGPLPTEHLAGTLPYILRQSLSLALNITDSAKLTG